MIRSSSRVRRSSPRLERLEDRTVPAAIQFQQIGPVLTILGTSGPDVVNVQDTGTGVINVFCPPNPTPSVFFGLNHINVLTLAGNDSVTYTLAQSGSFASLSLVVKLGAGNDTFVGSIHGAGLFTGTTLSVNVWGMAGSDNLRFDAAGNVNLQGGSLNVQMYGGAPSGRTFPGVDLGDTIRFNFSGFTSNNLTLIADGGSNGAADRIQANIGFNPGSFGTIFARVRGGGGNDTLRLAILQNSPTDPFSPGNVLIDALLDGGPGIDSVFTTPNVFRRNVP